MLKLIQWTERLRMNHPWPVLLAAVFSGLLGLAGIVLMVFSQTFSGILCLAITWVWLAWLLAGSRPSGTSVVGLLLVSLAYLWGSFQLQADDRFYIGTYALSVEVLFFLFLLWLWPDWIGRQDKKDKLYFLITLFLGVVFNFACKIPVQLYWLAAPLFLAAAGLGLWNTQPQQGANLQPGSNRFALPALLGIMLATLLISQAWISEDAFITFRTVDNFIHGYGLRWNVLERVQTFTHPLWLLIMAGAAFFSREFFYTATLLNLLFSLATVLLLLTRLRLSVYSMLLGWMLFSFSKAFMDYSSSGLENALLCLLLAIFFLVYASPPNKKNFFFQYLLVALIAMTRLDAVLLVVPAAWVTSRQAGLGWRQKLGSAALGLLPLLAWEMFAFVYYGFLFPNTAYAKLSTGLPPWDLIVQGAGYFMDSLIKDPLTLGVLLLAMALPWLLSQSRRLGAISLGMLLYLGYICWIGGDFMSGRFFSAPYVFGVALLLALTCPTQKSLPAMFAAFVCLSLVSPENPWLHRPEYRNAKTSQNLIADERGFYFPYMGLINFSTHPQRFFKQDWVRLGQSLKKKGTSFYIHPNAGLLGFYAGPGVRLIDQFALTDPLLARLPAIRGTWRIGHFVRMLPPGYVDTLQTGQNHLADPGLRAYYQDLKSITQGPLWSAVRWRAMLKMNLGLDNHWIDKNRCQGRVLLPTGERFLLLMHLHEPETNLLMQAGVDAALQADWKKASELWKTILKTSPGHLAAIADLGVAEEQAGHLENAMSAYAQVARSLGDPWEAYYHSLWKRLTPARQKVWSYSIHRPLVRFYAETFDNTQYDQWVQEGLQSPAAETARARFQAAVQLDPRRPEAHANLALLAEMQGNLALAYPEYLLAAKRLGRPWSQFAAQVRQKLAAPQPQPRPLPGFQDRRFIACVGDDDYSRLNQQALQSALKNQLAAAEKKLRSAIGLQPDRPEAKANLGIVLEMQGQYQQAMDCYLAAAQQLGKPWSDYLEQVRKMNH